RRRRPQKRLPPQRSRRRRKPPRRRQRLKNLPRRRPKPLKWRTDLGRAQARTGGTEETRSRKEEDRRRRALARGNPRLPRGQSRQDLEARDRSRLRREGR